MKSKYLLLLLFVAVSFSGFSQNSFKFNEYSCANVSTLNNPIGVGTQTTPDWVEIMNTTSVRFVKLSGWYISDDRNLLNKWQIPYYNNAPILIDSFSMQVIFLDGYNKSLASGGTVPTQTVDLHANFQLNQTQPSSKFGQTYKGPWLYLTKPAPSGQPQSSNPTDSVQIQRNQPGHSWGKPNSDSAFTSLGTNTPNTSKITGYRLYKTPSPGKKNLINANPITTTRNWYIGYAPTPKFSIPPGFASSNTSLDITDTTINSTNPNFNIYVTTDCTPPNNYTLAASGQQPVALGQGLGTGSINMPLPFNGVNNAVPVGIIVRALIHDEGTPPAYLDGFEAYGAYILDSTYKMNVICTCVDTANLFINRSTNNVPAIYSYVSKTTRKELYKNQGQALVNKVDFYNNIGAGSKDQAWQFQYRSEDEYGYNYTSNYSFYQDGNLGATARADFPEILLRSAAEDNFLPLGSGAGGNGATPPPFQGYGYGPTHVRDFFNHTITLRHKLNFESSHYAPTYLFINGVNKGIYYIKEPMDTTYMRYYYGYKQSDIIANDVVPTTNTAQITALAGSYATWSNLYNLIMPNSFNIHNPVYYQRVADSIDLPSFIDYNFYNMFSVNTNFTKNQALWWKGADTIVHNKKWRFGLSNTDLTWGFGNNTTGIADNSPTSSPCDYINAFGPAANNQFPLIPLFGKLMTNDTFKSDFLSRYQDLLNTSYACDTLVEHLKYVRSLIKGDMPSQVFLYQDYYANQGNCSSCDSVRVWNDMVDSMNVFMTQRCSLAVQGIKNCYGYDGPYNLCVDVFPPNAGYVKFNSLTLKSFVWNGKYLDSVTNIAHAIPDSNYVFDYWETPYNINPNKNSDSINFFVDRDACIKAHFKLKPAYETTGDPMLPTAFSPNGDGNNDNLNVYGIANATSYDFEIYNRWGQQIFHSMDKTQGWDGMYNGVNAPVGVYAYRYNIIIGGKTYINKGNFTLLR